MRTLTLIIMLTSAICYGQGLDPTLFVRIAPQITYITLEDMDAYWQECWNDSTKRIKTGTMLRDGNSDKWYLVENGGRWYGDEAHSKQVIIETWYTHREPTFAGFREWMRRKK